MRQVIVRPMGAAHETLWVALLCFAIVIASAATILLRVRTDAGAGLASWQIDARHDLNAAEQGINADLRAAAGEIVAALAEGPAPAPERLAADGVPPFAKDATTKRRGDHVWTLHAGGGTTIYLGRSGNPAVAGSLLLRIPAAPPPPHAHHDRPAAVWLNRAHGAAATGFDEQVLIASGWQEVVSRFNASVTRGGH